jgi:dihydrofolate reductase
MKKNEIKLIHLVAASTNGIIGSNDQIPWRAPDDLKRFKKLTLGHYCIVGRKTYDTIKHLKDRKFIVITRNPNQGDSKPYSGLTRVIDGVIFTSDLDSAIEMAKINAKVCKKDKVFIIGGGEIYKMTESRVDEVYLTRIHKEVELGDAFYKLPEGMKLDEIHHHTESNGLDTTYENYLRTH